MKWPQFVTDRAERPALHSQSAIFGQRKITLQKRKKHALLVCWHSEIPRHNNSSYNEKNTLGIIEQLLGDGRSSYDAPLNHLLGDLTGQHTTGLCVLRGHHHALCGGTQEMVLLFKRQKKKKK